MVDSSTRIYSFFSNHACQQTPSRQIGCDGILTFPNCRILNDSPNIKCPLTSVARKVHHFIISELPSRISSSRICETASRTFSRTTGSHTRRSSDLEKGRAKSFRRAACCFGSRIVNTPGRRSNANLEYHSVFRKGVPTRWISLNSAMDEIDTSSGEIRTMGPYLRCRSWMK